MKLSVSFKEFWKPSIQAFQLVRRTLSPFWCFVFAFTLFNLQGTRPASLSTGVLFILALPLSLVKNFFQVLSKFFLRNPLFSVLSSSPAPSGANSFSLPHALRFVKNFFRILFRSPSGFRPVSSAPAPLFSSPPRGAQLEYQLSPPLSTTFFAFS